MESGTLEGMKRFAWTPVTGNGRRFDSPRFTELQPGGAATAGESPEVRVAPFERAVLSWNGEGDWRLEMRLLVGGAWTPYAPLGALTRDGRQRSATRAEESLSLPKDARASLEVDTLVVRGREPATAFQVRARGEGDLRVLTVTHYRRDDRRYTDRPAVPGVWGVTLPVPERRQRDVEDPRISGDVCSPTSLGMVLEYHGRRHRTLDLAQAARDTAAGIYGNWPCNTGVAARLLGGWAAVAKMAGFDEVEREIAARRPVILSHRWERGDLTGAPVSRSNGHLIVAVGFTESGDVVVNDPAARQNESPRRVYRRRELFKTWQERGEGIAYLIHPS